LELAAALKYYTIEGDAGSLLDSKTDTLDARHPFQVFEMKYLLSSENPKIISPVFNVIFHRLEQSMSQGKPTLVIIDEFGAYTQSALFCQRIKTWLLEKRKDNAAIVPIIQSIEQLADTGLTSTVNSSCLTKIYLPNPEADSPTLAHEYQQFGLSDILIQMIKNAVRKLEYIVTSTKGQRKIQFNFESLAKLFFASASNEIVRKEIDLLIQAHGDDWPRIYLEQQGEHEWSNYWQMIKDEQYDKTIQDKILA
ncbi:hypothetical protein HRU45_03760, partial [Candidatus Dependentiae bacterium]|nr:hypothetical protein [Candidatus Dependentiae bacterium]